MVSPKKIRLIITAIALLHGYDISAQLIIDNATFFIQPGAMVTVQGNVTSNVDMQGTGKLLLKGNTKQDINMNGFSIPNLEMDNPANATLTGNAKIGTDLLFTNGKIQLANFNLTMNAGPAGTITNAGNAGFLVTNGTGKLIKTSLGATAFMYPVGNTTTTYRAKD